MVPRHHGSRRVAINVLCAHLGTSFNTFRHYRTRWGRVALRSTAVGDAVLACPDLLPSAWPLLDLGCLRPDGLPQTLMLFVNIGVPVVARWNGVPTDDNFDAGDIADRHRPTVEMDGNLAVWLEDEVVGLTRCNVFEVLRFRRHAAARRRPCPPRLRHGAARARWHESDRRAQHRRLRGGSCGSISPSRCV